MIFLILILGLFLRIFDIGSTYYFTGELGKELLYLRQFSLAGKLPVVGMATSHEWLSYGPFYYWIMMPVFKIFSGNPFILFWAATVVFAVGLVLGYFVVKKIAGKNIALYASLIQAISPLMVYQSRLSKLHAFFLILIPVFMYLLYRIWNGEKKWVFWAGLTFGFMFSFHFSQIPLLGVVILLFWIKRDRYKTVNWLKFGAGVLLPNLTLIWQDRNLALWLPYRVLNIAEKNPAGTFASLNEYFGSTLLWDNRFWILGFAIFAVLFFHYSWINRMKLTKEFLPFYVISSISLMLIANILHGAPPIHYFLPVFTTVPILYSIYLSKTRWGLVLLAVIFLVNYKSYLMPRKYEDYVPYERQLAIADFIISDAKGSDFSIKRVGPFDYFPEEYSQNYKYMVLWKGGNLTENSGNVYTINDYLNTVTK